MTLVSSCNRELDERASSGTRVRLLWRQGTRQLWVEVREPGMDQALAILVPPERALDAFHHPYAYIGLQGPLRPLQSLARREHRPQAAEQELP